MSARNGLIVFMLVIKYSIFNKHFTVVVAVDQATHDKRGSGLFVLMNTNYLYHIFGQQ